MPRPEEVFSVSAITEEMRLFLEKEFYSVWVAGEVTNFRHNGGHMYFALKDANAQIQCRFFRGSNLRLRFDLKDGLHILARGPLTFYSTRGDAYLNVLEAQPKGIGAAELALRQLKEKLLTRGYFDPKRKRKRLPAYPKRVALVASATGAAIRDMLELFAQRWPLTDVVVVNSRVQGDFAGRELASAVRMLGTLHNAGSCRLDAIVLGRGGGSAEDLAAFNEEVLADAIYRSPVPVISAVGHETDISIADLVADIRSETPSAAVVALTPDRRQLAAELNAVGERFRDAMTRRIRIGRQRLDQIAGRPVFRRPEDQIRRFEQRLDDLAARMNRAVETRRTRAGDRLAALAARLESLSPLQVLGRGYSLTHKAGSRKLIRDAAEVAVGDEILTRVANGEIVSEVRSTNALPSDPRM